MKSKVLLNQVEELNKAIKAKELEKQKLHEEIDRMNQLKRYYESDINLIHANKPRPGDFWHDCYSPVMIILDVNEEEIVICENTIDNEDGYSFDLHKTRKVNYEQFSKMIKFYTAPELKDTIGYRVIPYRCLKEVEIWKEKNKKLSSFSSN